MIHLDKTLKVPFTLFFEGTAAKLSGSFANGDARVKSSAGEFSGTTLRLQFQPTGIELEGTLLNGQLSGSVRSPRYGELRFTSAAYCTCNFDGEAGPDIAGSWTTKGELWRIALRRVGEDTFAEVSTPSATIGPLSGRFDGVSFNLRYFDGMRAVLLELEPAKDGSLDLTWQSPEEGSKKFNAVRVKAD